MNHLDFIRENKVIAIVRGIPSGSIAALAEAIVKGGLRCMEVTFDHSSEKGIEETLKSIEILSRDFQGELLAGAGTVLTPKQAEQAAAAGAEYMISPNVNVEVIKKTKELGKISIPGALTPSEIVTAYEAGADIVKLFPAAVFGPAYFKAVKAPLKHIPVTAVGGISPENIADFLAAGAVGAGVGGNLVSPKLVAEGRFDEITEIARSYAEALKK